ncbi:hypothetical protein PR048_015756 [Dryococelus australis]|uniref:Tesmin/TSO1-like CXC domain-containing protein n=1 Tax=Dryococelus australis TaxID=614101 RepID=A0ABQ9HHU1_9NEOP|nr:hypothetical protein PR048_015756 [Dryococelus australis]
MPLGRTVKLTALLADNIVASRLTSHAGDGLNNDSLKPERWGWVRDDGGVLNPVNTTYPIAPDSVLNSIFCRCATGCGGRCECRKAGIHCSSICGCDGACMNSAHIRKKGVEEDEDFMNFEATTEL